MIPSLRLAAFSCLIALVSGAATNEVRTHNTPCTFPPITSQAEWQSRAKEIREQALVSCGLWPMPEKTPLNARVFDRVERDGYSIEKVAFESWPGFHVCGNLYRPLGRGAGPFPGVLNPHGHWKEGRLTDAQEGSVPARCINFARRGMVALAYDMVGYNDTFFANHPRETGAGFDFYQRHRLFATNALCQLWGISLMGLQSWNSLRALDFLESLPDVDSRRLACTGASGGGTQTFMLGVLDDRLAAQAPVCMVSHSMQGGCACENAPGLRVRFSNMEIAAAAAPRPQLLVAATGDWTKHTPTVEGPALESIYRLLGTPERFRAVQFEAGHNYNQTSREVVYAWFERWLLAQPDAPASAESAYQKPPDGAARVWGGGALPANAVSDEEFITSFIQRRQKQLTALLPRTKRDLETFRHVMLPLWRHTLQLEWPENDVRLAFKPVRSGDGFSAADFEMRRAAERGVIAATWFKPRKPTATARPLVVLVSETDADGHLDTTHNPRGLAGLLIENGHGVVALSGFAASPTADAPANFYTTYNRTLLQERVRDLATLCACVRSLANGGGKPSVKVVLHGEGRAGLWCALAAPAADGVIADARDLKAGEDPIWIEPSAFCPGFNALGGWETAVLLAAPHPLWLHGQNRELAAERLEKGFRNIGQSNRLRVTPTAPGDSVALFRWLRGV